MAKEPNMVRANRERGAAMATQVDWEGEVKGLLKAEVKRRNLTYEQLAAKLTEIGVHDSARNIINKINRGTFSAVFFVQCLRAMGCKAVSLE
jgi:3-mercaptopyruvate sulfurtransferase SseA